MRRARPRSAADDDVALGARVKSGWAAVVLVGGPPDAPRLIDSRRLELADPRTPASIQPYHAGFGRAQPDDRVVGRLISLVEQCAAKNCRALVEEYRRAGHAPRRAAVIGTSATDPATITNAHIRIHALEGRLFRRVSVDALTACGVRCVEVLEADLRADAQRLLTLREDTLTRTLATLGRSLPGPWRSEQKAAALAAWALLATPRRRA